jgi:threonine/homoserine/homoserine lactone efflux protein
MGRVYGERMSEPWTLFAMVAGAHALGVASPGPDFAVVLRTTLRHGRRAGTLTALGIGSGILFHVAWGLFGLGWAVERFPFLSLALRYAGAAFLFWMGLRALRAPAPVVEGGADAPLRPALSGARAYFTGLATNLLNAKAFLFFVALCSGLVTSGVAPTLRLALGAWLVLATAAFFSFIAATVGHPRVRARLLAHAQRIDRAMGVLLIALSLWIALGF